MKHGIIYSAVVLITLLLWQGCTIVEPTRYDPGISLNMNAISIKGDAYRTVVKVTSKNAWKVEAPAGCDWVTFSKSEGEYTEEIIMNVAENPSRTDSRETELKFTSAGVTKSLTVTQDKFIGTASIVINGRSYEFPDLAKENEFSYTATSEASVVSMGILTNRDWSLKTSTVADWVKYDHDKGTAGILSPLNLDLAENKTGGARSSSLVLEMGDMSLIITMTQDKTRKYVFIDDEIKSLVFDNVGGKVVELGITSNCNWEVVGPDWIAASPSVGNGSGTIKLYSPGMMKVDGEWASGIIKIMPSGAPGADDQHVEIEAVRQGSRANTYCVTHPGSYSFPALDYDGNPISADEVDWVWNSTPGQNITSNLDISSSGVVSFNVGEVKGFELIAALQNDKIIRVWNIWSTEEINEVTVGATTYLDRNIGAPISGYTDLDRDEFNPDCCGALFMWGTPMGFPSGRYSHTYWTGSRFEGVNVETVPFSTSTSKYDFNSRFGSFKTFTATATNRAYIEDILSTPWNVPLGNPATSANIYGESWNEWTTFWQDNVKGKYDPCPAGYKVPTNSQLSTLVNADLSSWNMVMPYVEGQPASTSSAPNGYSSTRIYYKDDQVFVLPTGGMRFNGNIIQLGGRTCYYTSTPNTSYKPYIINYDYSVGNYSDQHNRMYSIRCVKF